MLRKLLSLILMLLLLCSLLLPAAAAGTDALEAAGTLHALGLFGGVGSRPDGTPDYDLDRAPTRHEAITMLVRLLGKEAEARAGTWTTPLTDVAAWAQPYVGYAYAHGLTTGMSATTFCGEEPVTAAQYLTFVLRALGYVSGEDFRWDRAWEKTDELGITQGNYGAANNNGFLRADVVLVSRAALDGVLKDSGERLLDHLVAGGAVTEHAAGALEPDVYTLFAQQLLAEDCEICTLPVQDKSFSDKELEPFVGAVDTYLAGSSQGIHDEQERIELLTWTLREYVSACVDGDYNNYTPVGTTHGNLDCNYALLVTDEKGTVVGYGFYDADGPEEITVYLCSVDSRAFVKEAVRELRDSIDSLPRVDCQLTREGDAFIFQFGEIPAGAVRLNCNNWGLRYADPPTEQEFRKRLESYVQGGFVGVDIGVPVQNPYTYDEFLWPNDHGYAYCVVVFLDAAGWPVAYAVGELKI